jgi:lysophospholipase L1-like esterase
MPLSINNSRIVYKTLLAFCALAFCTEAATDTIAVLGSSTAEGTGATVYDSAWVGRYLKYVHTLYPNRAVLNLAKGGYTSFQLLPTHSPLVVNRPAPDTTRNISRALKSHPIAIILNIVSNDIANGWPGSDYLKNIDTICATAKRSGVPIWVTTIQPRNFTGTEAWKRDTLKALFVQMKARYVPHCIDFWTGTAADDGSILPALNSGDGIHLNNTGHRIVFSRVVDSHLLDTLDHRTSVNYVRYATIHSAAHSKTASTCLKVNLLGKNIRGATRTTRIAIRLDPNRGRISGIGLAW